MRCLNAIGMCAPHHTQAKARQEVRASIEASYVADSQAAEARDAARLHTKAMAALQHTERAQMYDHARLMQDKASCIFGREPVFTAHQDPSVNTPIRTFW